eukprot:jgi/Mesen1/9125/ME000058S08618
MFSTVPHPYTGAGHVPGPPPLPQDYVGESSAPEAAGHKFQVSAGPTKHSQYPVTTGTSVLGITYKDGILIAADTMAAYGSTLRYKSVERIKAVGKYTAIGATGEISDFYHLMTLLDELMTNDFTFDDGIAMGPEEIHNYLNRVLYNRRNKFDPLWNSLVIGGYKDGKPYLGTVDKLGVHYTSPHVATGFGNHLARPIFRNEHREDMTEEEGIKLLEKCLRVLFYRDKAAFNKVQIAKITAAGVEVSKPYALTSKWDYNFFVNPTKGVEGSW